MPALLTGRFVDNNVFNLGLAQIQIVPELGPSDLRRFGPDIAELVIVVPRIKCISAFI